MAYVVTVQGLRPLVRVDGVAWTHVHIEEAADEDGPWAQIDDQPLVPVDTNPMAPRERAFTTVNATMPGPAWYRVTFLDPADNQQVMAPTLQSASEASAVPTLGDIRAQSLVSFAELGYAAPTGGDPDKLGIIRDEAVNEFYGSTGIDPWTVIADPADPNYERRTPLIRKAIRQFVEYDIGSSQPEVLATAYDYDLLESFSIGSYSETRRNNMRSGLSVRNMYHPWPELNRTLNTILHFGDLFGRGQDVPTVQTQPLLPEPGREFMGPDWPFGLQWYTGDGLYGMRVRIGGSGPPMVLP